MLVTGHTDTVGPPEYNRGLSVERAESIAQFLLDDVDAWMTGYGPHAHSQPWGVREDQFMLATLTDAAGAPFYAGTVDGAAGSGTRAAYQHFQDEHGLPRSGRGDDVTRRALVQGYMALEGTSLPAGTTALTHGCGLTHLKVETGPGVPNEDNRRDEIFLFDGEVAPAPQTPCPPKGCDEYQQWVDQTLISVDLDHPLPSLEVEVRDETGAAVAAGNAPAVVFTRG